MKNVEIICTLCGNETLLRREPIFEGFSKTGELLSCSGCGHTFTSEEEVPFNTKQAAPAIFSEADRSDKIEVFDEGENQRLCRYCANYIINPFTQFCAVHKKEVQATDHCEQFQEPPAEAPKNSTL